MNIEPIDINVLHLLPQRPPFIMVDKLTYCDPKHAKTVFLVRADNIFCHDGVMEEAGLVENIAQTCAARTGFKQRLEQNGQVVLSVSGAGNTPIDGAVFGTGGTPTDGAVSGTCGTPIDGAVSGTGGTPTDEAVSETGGIPIDGAVSDSDNTLPERAVSGVAGKVKIGVIASIDSLEMKRRPLVGEVLETSMTIEEEFFATTLVRSEVQTGGETIAVCRMKLFLTDKIPD